MFPFFKSFVSLSKARLSGIILICAALAVAAVALMVFLITAWTSCLTVFETGWINTAITWGAGVISGIGGWFILPAFMVFFAGLFQDRIIFRVEAVFYPDSCREAPTGIWPDFFHDIRFTLKALLLNILILPLYLFGIGFIFSVLLNSYLLGREFFESAAGYHLGKPAARAMGREERTAVYGGGFVIVVMTLLPLINLIMPVLATVWMVHVYHAIRQKNAA